MMHRSQFGQPGQGIAVPNQQFFDNSTGSSSQQQGYNSHVPLIPPLSGGHGQQVHGGHPGAGVNPNTTAPGPVPSVAAPLTFTPSSSGGSHPPFKNMRTTMKTLSDNYENAFGGQSRADAAFLQNYMTGLEKSGKSDHLQSSGGSADQDDKSLLELEVKPDAEVLALIHELSALDTLRQTSSQSTWTARHLPQTAASHFDANLEMPLNMDNSALAELQQTAIDQINFVKKNRRLYVECIASMARHVQPPSQEDVDQFLRDEIYKQ